MPIFFQITPSSLPISIGSIGKNWKQESIIRKEGYPHYHWLQTERGTGEIQINGELIRLNENEGILIKPFTPHSYLSNEGWITKFITFNGSLSDEFERIVGKHIYIKNRDSNHFNYSEWIDNTIEIYLSETKNNQELSVGCYEFLLNLSKLNSFSNFEEASYKNYVLPTINKLENNFNQKFNLDELSKDLFISPQYLSRIFKKYTQKTVFSYLQSVRINKAKEFLINHETLKIQEITDLCGFSDSSYFISLFKKTTGYTPLQFRKIYLIRKH